MSATTDEERAEYVAGLRKLAAILEAVPTLAVPWRGADSTMPMDVIGHNREDVAAWATLLDDATETTDAEYHHLKGHIAGLHVYVITPVGRVGGRRVVREVETFEVEPFLTAEPEPVSA
jgi:hypothetical protein